MGAVFIKPATPTEGHSSELNVNTNTPPPHPIFGHQSLSRDRKAIIRFFFSLLKRKSWVKFKNNTLAIKKNTAKNCPFLH